MKKAIEIEEHETANKPIEIHVPAGKISGFLGWYRPEGCGWVMLFPYCRTGQIVDAHRCPYPLFQSKDEAIKEAEKVLPNGGTIKLLFVEL